MDLLELCDSVCASSVSLSSHSATANQYCLCPRRQNLLVYTASSANDNRSSAYRGDEREREMENKKINVCVCVWPSERSHILTFTDIVCIELCNYFSLLKCWIYWNFHRLRLIRSFLFVDVSQLNFQIQSPSGGALCVRVGRLVAAATQLCVVWLLF